MSELIHKDIADTLKEILKWTRFAGLKQLNEVLSQNLKTEQEKMEVDIS